MIAELLAAVSLAAPAPPVVRLGDHVAVQGTAILCTVVDIAQHRELGCGLFDAKGPIPASYGIVADDEFAIVSRYDAKRRPQLVARQPQPSVPGPPIVRVVRKIGPARTLLVRAGGAFAIEGNRMRCLVAGTQRILVCYEPAANGNPATGSYELGIGPATVQLAQAQANGNSKLLLVRAHGV